MGSSTVAILRVRPDHILEDVDRLCELGGVSGALEAGAPTILKDNLSWHFPFPAANTTPWQLEGTILALRRRGYEEQTCVANRTVVTDAFKGEDLNHYRELLRRHGVPVRYNFKPEDMAWVSYRPRARLRALDRVFPDGIRIPDFFLGKNVVHLPTVKCHIYTTTTGAMKNAFGGLLHERRHYCHSAIHETLVDLLAIQKEIHPGLFAVMDGTTAGDGPGPRTMRPVVKDVMLASGDQVAIDAVAARMMGFDPLAIPYLRMAEEDGLGVADPRRIALAGDVALAEERWGFEVGDNGASLVGDLVWFGPLRPLEKLCFRTPLVKLFVLGSEIYHDLYRWPARDRATFLAWQRGTAWGRLFEAYGRGEILAPAAAAGGRGRGGEAPPAG
ncbi:MAG TPA: DUF362 domain-containing protein [Anaeromyxobacteraceae bacterium]|nr:DUF362 domain-containing protein [Anaeromyxobacteraceae bacterium]